MKPDYKLLSGSKDMYGIYRMKDTKENEEYKQQGMLHPFHENHKVFRENYELIYVGEIHHKTTCEKLVNSIRRNPPEDFPALGTTEGHVLALSQGGNLEFYYSEEYGAILLNNFAKDFSTPKEQYNNMTEEDILSEVLAIAHAEFEELNAHDLDYQLQIVDVKIYGSRERGNYTAESDIDVLLEYEGDLKESEVFNILNESGMSIGGMKLDINPIRAEESGTIEEYLIRDQERRRELEENNVFIETFEQGDVLIFKDEKSNVKNEEYHILNRQQIRRDEPELMYEGFALIPIEERPGTYDLDYPFDFSIDKVAAIVRNGVRYEIEENVYLDRLPEAMDLPFPDVKGYTYYAEHGLIYPINGELSFEVFDERKYIEEIGRDVYGKVTFDRELTQEELTDYDLIPDPNNPHGIPTRVFFDMDGTTTVFRPVERIETLYEKGYFANLAPNTTVIDAIKALCNDPNFEIYIMSSVLSDSQYALEEKNAWLDKYLPEINASHRIFPPCGENKLAYIPDGVRPSDCLVDDYTTNLVQWEPPAKGIKLLNGINHTNQTWTGNMVSFEASGTDIAKKIRNIVEGAFIQDVRPQDNRQKMMPDFDADIRELKEEVQELQSLIKNVVPNFGTLTPDEPDQKVEVIYYAQKWNDKMEQIVPFLTYKSAKNAYLTDQEREFEKLGVMINGISYTLVRYDSVTNSYSMPGLYELDVNALTETQKGELFDNITDIATTVNKENAFLKAYEVAETTAFAASHEIRKNHFTWGNWSSRISTDENPQNYIDIDVTGYERQQLLVYEINVVSNNEVVDNLQLTINVDETNFENSITSATIEGRKFFLEKLPEAIEKMNTSLSEGIDVYSAHYGDRDLQEHFDALEQKGFSLEPRPWNKEELDSEKDVQAPNVRPINAPQPKKPRL